MELENTPAYHEDFHVSYLQSVEIRVIRGVESLPLTPPREKPPPALSLERVLKT
jgi:hypothetical protein